MSQIPTPPQAGPDYPVVAPTVLPIHEHASLALGLGVIGLLGSCLCGVGLLVSPFALGIGLSARRAIREEPGRWGGDGMALGGVALGAIGVAMLVLLILAAVTFGILIMAGVIQPSASGGISA